MPDIFLSYNREDQAVARWFAEAFTTEGFDVWWDTTLRSGEAYDEVTENALRTAKAVVVLWSPRSVLSRWVRAEATLAERNKTFMPVMIEPCERPIMFELVQTADLCHWNGARHDSAFQALAQDVRRRVAGESAPSAGPPAAKAPPAKPREGQRGERPLIAVLPFGNRSGLAEDDVFAFGMGEDVIDALARAVDVRVLTSSMTAQFRTGAAPDFERMVRELGVRYALEGNVRRLGPDLRVTTQIVDAGSGNIVWSRKFDRPIEQLAQLQEELVLDIAAHLRAQSNRLELERALRKPSDLTAWEAVMRAVAAKRRLDPEAIMTGLVEARRAMEIAPDYGLAVALVAQDEAVVYHQMSPDNPSETVRIRAQAERAIALDPDSSLVLSTASGALHTAGFPEDGLRVAKRAIQLSGENSFAFLAAGTSCCGLGRFEEAIGYYRRAVEVSPDGPNMWMSWAWWGLNLIAMGRWEEALVPNAEALRLAPENAWPNLDRAVCLEILGRQGEARESFTLARKYDTWSTLELWEMRFRRSLMASPFVEQYLQAFRKLWNTAPVTAG